MLNPAGVRTGTVAAVFVSLNGVTRMAVCTVHIDWWIDRELPQGKLLVVSHLAIGCNETK